MASHHSPASTDSRRASAAGGTADAKALPPVATLHRPIDPAMLRRILGEGPLDLTEVYRAGQVKVSTFDHIRDALSSDLLLAAWLGFCGGCFFTVGAAFVWGLFL